MTLSERLQRLPRLGVLGLSVLLLGLVGYSDYLLPFEVTLLMFYFVPIFFAAWFADRTIALVMAVLSTFAWWLANLHSDTFSFSTHNWVSINRLVVFTVAACGSAAMRAQRETMQVRLAALERTRELEEEIVRVSEREQMRIGQDLHDGLCQHLAAIDCAMACLKLDLEERRAPEVVATAAIQAQLGSAIAEARDMARGIFPVQMEEEGFLAALGAMVENTNRLRQLQVTLDADEELRIPDPQKGMHLFRIAQEGLNNAVKHAQATAVRITLHRRGAHLAMTIADNGTGLRPERPGSKGLGMQTMRYRVKSMDGSLEIHSAPARGTEVRCLVPLEPFANDHDHPDPKSAHPRGAGGGSPDVPRISRAPDREESLLHGVRGNG